jgi:hypothetical protein
MYIFIASVVYVYRHTVLENCVLHTLRTRLVYLTCFVRNYYSWLFDNGHCYQRVLVTKIKAHRQERFLQTDT